MRILFFAVLFVLLAHLGLSVLLAPPKAPERMPPAQLEGMLRPICPDQWVAMRPARGRWRVHCVLASTEGSRVH